MKIPKSIQEIQRTTISPQEIIDLVEEMGRIHQEDGRDPDWYSAMFIVAERYRGSHGKAFCIMERMQCLSEVTKDSRMRGWSMQRIEEGCLLTSEAVFRATALCPLRADEKNVWFDPDEFFKVVLSETESEGRA